jgi:hypothetical protein
MQTKMLPSLADLFCIEAASAVPTDPNTGFKESQVRGGRKSKRRTISGRPGRGVRFLIRNSN